MGGTGCDAARVAFARCNHHRNSTPPGRCDRNERLGGRVYQVSMMDWVSASCMLQGAKRNVFAIFALLNGGDEMNMPGILLFSLFPTAKAININILFLRGLIYSLIAPFDALFQLLLHMAAKFYALQTSFLASAVHVFARMLESTPVRLKCHVVY